MEREFNYLVIVENNIGCEALRLDLQNNIECFKNRLMFSLFEWR